MKLLVCGGGDYGFTIVKTSRHPVIRLNPQEIYFLFQKLDEIHAATPVSAVVEGCAPGADVLGAIWAASRGIAVEEYPADCDSDGSSAGPRRNHRQFREGKPNRGAAFGGGIGTADMIRILMDGKVEVHHYRWLPVVR